MRRGSVFKRQHSYRLVAFIIASVSGLLLPQLLQAQFDDPTLPPNTTSIAVNNSNEAITWKLSSILVSPQRNIAIINGQSVQVGDLVVGARVQSINEAIVKLKHRGEIIQLQLFPVTVKTLREE